VLKGRIWFLVLCLLCIGPFVQADEIHTGEYTLIRQSEWEMLTALVEDAPYSDPGEFLHEADIYIEEISTYLGRENWIQEIYQDRVEFISVRHLPSYTFGTSNIALNTHNLAMNIAPTAREIAYLILRGFNSHSLKIGLASVMQDQFGQNVAPYNLGQDPHELAKRYFDNELLLQAVGKRGYPFHLDLYPAGREREGLYILSHSFVKFLLEERGISGVMEVYEASDLYSAYREVFGRDLEDLQRDWLEHLQ